MTYQPAEIARKTFMTTLRGYDRYEVAAFLRAVAEDYEAALERASSRQISPGARDVPAGVGRPTPASVDVTATMRTDGGLTLVVQRRLSPIAAAQPQDELLAMLAESNERLERLETALGLLLAGEVPGRIAPFQDGRAFVVQLRPLEGDAAPSS